MPDEAGCEREQAGAPQTRGGAKPDIRKRRRAGARRPPPVKAVWQRRVAEAVWQAEDALRALVRAWAAGAPQTRGGAKADIRAASGGEQERGAPPVKAWRQRRVAEAVWQAEDDALRALVRAWAAGAPQTRGGAKADIRAAAARVVVGKRRPRRGPRLVVEIPFNSLPSSTRRPSTLQKHDPGISQEATSAAKPKAPKTSVKCARATTPCAASRMRAPDPTAIREQQRAARGRAPDQ